MPDEEPGKYIGAWFWFEAFTPTGCERITDSDPITAGVQVAGVEISVGATGFTATGTRPGRAHITPPTSPSQNTIVFLNAP